MANSTMKIKLLLPIVLLLLFSGVADAGSFIFDFTTSGNQSMSEGTLYPFIDGLGSIYNIYPIVNGNQIHTITAGSGWEAQYSGASPMVIFNTTDIPDNFNVIEMSIYVSGTGTNTNLLWFDDSSTLNPGIGWANKSFSPTPFINIKNYFSGIGFFRHQNGGGTNRITKLIVTTSESLPPPSYDPSGYVNDSLGNPLAGVNVTYGSTTVWSNATGWYDLGSSFANGTYSYSIKHGFYTTQTGTITTTQGGSIVNYTLVAKCSGSCDTYAAKNGSDAITEITNSAFVESILPDSYFGDWQILSVNFTIEVVDESYIELPINRSSETLNLYAFEVTGAPFNVSVNNAGSFNDSAVNYTWNNKSTKSDLLTTFTVNSTGWYTIQLSNPWKYIVLTSYTNNTSVLFRSDDATSNKPSIYNNNCRSWSSACLNISRAVNLSQEYSTVHIGYGNYSNQTKINGTRSMRYFCDVAGYNESGYWNKCRFPPFGR